jgi:hypothetical protein
MHEIQAVVEHDVQAGVASTGRQMPKDLIVMSACLTTTLLAFPAPSLAADATARGKVALVDAIDLPESMGETRVRLRELFEAAARERGLDVGPSNGPPPCGDASCLPEVARGAGATDLIVVRGGRSADRDYHIELSLWQASTGEMVPAIADCTFCTGPQMAEAVTKAARPLLDRIVARRVAAPVQPPSTAPTVVTTPVVTPPSDKLESRRGRRIAGWSLVGLGAATGIAGGIIWNLDGNGTDCVSSTCRNTYRTQGTGIALVATGVVGVGAGLWLALDPLGRRDVALTLGPSGAVVAGRF